MKAKTFLSIIVPLYNEESRLTKGLEGIISFLQKQKIQSEIILVNDGSTDKTLKISQGFQKNNSKIKILSYKKNKGKGFAVKKGILASNGDWVMFCDIDLSVSITELSKFQKYLFKPPKVLIASRRVKGAKIVNHQPLIRENLGHIFTKLSNLILATRCKDFTCGFKIFDRNSAKKLFTKQQLNRWGFDSEIIFLTHKYQIPLKEIPITWKNSFETKVKLPKDSISAFLELIQVWVNNKKGLYD
jgi:dolichyl-phosphate beta-glucosyltransferase